jgi:hypothetical protein
MFYPSLSLHTSLLSLPIYINMKMHTIILGFRINNNELLGILWEHRGEKKWGGKRLACSWQQRWNKISIRYIIWMTLHYFKDQMYIDSKVKICDFFSLLHVNLFLSRNLIQCALMEWGLKSFCMLNQTNLYLVVYFFSFSLCQQTCHYDTKSTLINYNIHENHGHPN